MSIAEQTQQRVDGLRERLHEEYGDCPLVEETATVPLTRFERMAGVAPGGLLDGGAAFVTDDEGRILLLRAGDRPDVWTVPGGNRERDLPEGGTAAIEGDGSLEELAVEEVRDRTGVDCEITGLRFLRRTQFVPDEKDDERTLYVLDAFFDASADAREGDRPDEEGKETEEVGGDDVLEVRWFDEPPKTVDPLVEEHAETW
ncbi:NUDIX domain-containing protein [Halegenticoccus tardaugens]|uniref:NUDIX domain-containing protein n=1 Tax=Halegenticoccus tardaugens TaxID=2071624 RepID=UPI00100A447E|nr:NUDIX domain-containing protein [Halegenticoccus tardaugens]